MGQILQQKAQKGRLAHLAGLSAEDCVLHALHRRGYRSIAKRWRGQGGEIDLIMQSDAGVVFVEVKKARSFSMAALRIAPRQKARIFAAAQEFVSTLPEGQLTNMRFDVALVDDLGQVEILENALCDG